MTATYWPDFRTLPFGRVRGSPIHSSYRVHIWWENRMARLQSGKGSSLYLSIYNSIGAYHTKDNSSEKCHNLGLYCILYSLIKLHTK